jgi:phosphoribosylglycinamide formyltransferase-1
MLKIRLAIFASGAGSNALNILRHFENNAHIEVAFLMTNRKESPLVLAAKTIATPILVFDNEHVSDGEFLMDVCAEHKIDYVILAGYLRLIPKEFILNFKEKIINIHPSLLPNFGGKGMYGDNVHLAVLAAKAKNSGISIHFVDENFDEGRMLAQFYCQIEEEETLPSLKKKIQYLEHTYFPVVIEQTILNQTHA